MADENRSIDLSSIDREIETNRWWQVYCAVLGDGIVRLGREETQAADLADAAIDEAKKRGRLL